MSHPVIFNPRLVIGMILAGLLGFVCLLLLLAYGGGLGSRPQGAAHFQSAAATGYKGLLDLVRRLRPTSIVDHPDEIYGEDLLVVALQETHQPDQVQQLLESRQGRATLLILPKWFTVPDPARRGWVRSTGSGAGTIAGPLLGQRITIQHPAGAISKHAAGRDFLAGLDLPLPRQPQLVKGEGLVPLVDVRDWGALVARIGNQPHYLLADPDLVNNHGLRDPEVAQSALALLDSLNAIGAKGITFDTASELGSARGPSFLRIACEPPFLAMTLALVFAALLAGIHGAVRFGPPRREGRAIAFGKAALVENGAGLIRLAGREARLGPAYADLIRQDAARLTGAPQWLGPEALDQYLDRFGSTGRPRFSEVARSLGQATDRGSVVEAARDLYQWRKEIIR